MRRLPLVMCALCLFSGAVRGDDTPGFTVALADEPGGAAYSWRAALRACEGRAMAVPSEAELTEMYCRARREGNTRAGASPTGSEACERTEDLAAPTDFAPGPYWSSSRYNTAIARYLDFADGRRGYFGLDRPLRVRCVHRHAPAEPPPQRNNDIDRAAFDETIDTVIGLYRGTLARSGYRVRVSKRWASEEVKAVSWLAERHAPEGRVPLRTLEFEFTGGLARHPLLDRDAFALVVCHEVGHHLGSALRARGAAAEARADHFAAARCMPRYLAAVRDRPLLPEPLPGRLAVACRAAFPQPYERAACRRTVRAGLTLGRWFASIARAEADVRGTHGATGYPPPRRRWAIYIAGALCPRESVTPVCCAVVSPTAPAERHSGEEP